MLAKIRAALILLNDHAASCHPQFGQEGQRAAAAATAELNDLDELFGKMTLMVKTAVRAAPATATNLHAGLIAETPDGMSVVTVENLLTQLQELGGWVLVPRGTGGFVTGFPHARVPRPASDAAAVPHAEEPSPSATTSPAVPRDP